ELGVGVMLVGLGAATLVRLARRLRAPRLATVGPMDVGGRDSDAREHAHPAFDRLDARLGRFGVYRFVRPLLVGVVHGVAGSAAVAILVLATVRDARWGVAYLLV